MSTIVNKVVQMLPDPHAIFPSLDTPYSKYCDTNYAAWGKDIPAIREILSQQQQHIDDLDTIIKGVEDVLAKLRKKRDQIQSLKKAHEGFISSGIRRLPSEILSEIFMLCLPCMMYIEPDTKKAPLLMTWVCRRWREIAFDTPRLWCSLSIGLTFNKIMEPAQSISFYRHWLSNTRGHPLSLDVEVCNPERVAAVMAFSRPYITRCTELSINFEEAGGLHFLLKDVPILKCLELIGDMDTLRNAGSISIVQPQPRLRGLVIESPSFGPNILSIFNPGWTNLTHLSLTLDIDWDDVTDVDHDIFSTFLLSCTNLEHFIFSPFCLTHRNPVSLTHTKLRTLEIAKLYKRGSLQMGRLTFPALCSLKVLLDAESDVVPFSAVDISEVIVADEDLSMATVGDAQKASIVPAQHRICNVSIEPSLMAGLLLTFFDLGWSSLTHLKMNLVDTIGTFLALLQHCPNLEDFSIHVLAFPYTPPPIPFTHYRLRSLSIGMQTKYNGELLDSVTFPNLRHLSLDFPRRLRWAHEEFMKFLTRSCCPIETLDVRGVKEFKEEEWTELATLIPTLKRIELEAQCCNYSWTR